MATSEGGGESSARALESATYESSKWGGRYLRAPDIFEQIMENRKMVCVARYAQAHLGVTTGANEFFFVKRVGRGEYVTTISGAEIEVDLPEAYMHPVIRSATECGRYTFKVEDTDYRILVTDRHNKDERVLNYIRMAERAGIHRRPFFGGRKYWYEITNFITCNIAVSEIIYTRYFFLWNQSNCVLNKNLYGYTTDVNQELLYSLLSNTFAFLFFELTSRKPGAGASGISVKVANLLPILDPSNLGGTDKKALIEAGRVLRKREIMDVFDEVKQPDRQALDNVVFDVLKLTRGERDAVYEAVVELVKKRLEKAGSLAK
jgi:hypothetical protein